MAACRWFYRDLKNRRTPGIVTARTEKQLDELQRDVERAGYSVPTKAEVRAANKHCHCRCG